MREHPDKTAPEELSQQNAKDLSQKINDEKSFLGEHFEHPDRMRVFPLGVDDSSSKDDG